jgi:hypothetical protein
MISKEQIAIGSIARLGPLAYVTTRPVCGVYFAACQSWVKIGYAKDIRKRVSTIAAMNPHQIRLVAFIEAETDADARALEGAMHARFGADRYRLEWFHFTDNIRRFLEEMAYVNGAPPRS